MRVLVTRPEPDAAETAEKLRALGHEPVIAPFLRVIFAVPPADLPDPAAILLTSRNGARALSHWPQAAGWLGRPVLVTGHATAEAARRIGFKDVRSAGGDAADLADLVMSQIGNDGGPILFPAARDRSEGFLSALRAAGYVICLVEAYGAEMETAIDPVIEDAIRTGSIDGILFYSRRTAVAFRTLAEREGFAKDLKGVAFFALSDRVAAPLRGLSAAIYLAEHPDEGSLLALLPIPTG